MAFEDLDSEVGEMFAELAGFSGPRSLESQAEDYRHWLRRSDWEKHDRETTRQSQRVNAKAMRERRKAKGLCPGCSRKPEKGKKTCEVCLSKQRKPGATRAFYCRNCGVRGHRRNYCPKPVRKRRDLEPPPRVWWEYEYEGIHYSFDGNVHVARESEPQVWMLFVRRKRGRNTLGTATLYYAPSTAAFVEKRGDTNSTVTVPQQVLGHLSDSIDAVVQRREAT